MLTVAAWVITYLSWRTGKQTIWAYLEFGYMVAMLVNVFVPHLPSVFVFRRYMAGFGTAVLLNLPVLTFLAMESMRESYMSGRKPLAFGIGVPVGMFGDGRGTVCWRVHCCQPEHRLSRL